MTPLKKGDIIKVTKDAVTSIGLVTAVTATDVSIFRDSGDVWYDFESHTIEKLGEL